MGWPVVSDTVAPDLAPATARAFSARIGPGRARPSLLPQRLNEGLQLVLIHIEVGPDVVLGDPAPEDDVIFEVHVHVLVDIHLVKRFSWFHPFANEASLSFLSVKNVLKPTLLHCSWSSQE